MAVGKVVLTAWCLLEWRRHWRSVPEFFGFDWLDVVWRLEREFGVKLLGADFERLSADERNGLTAEQLWQVVADKLRNTGIDVPSNGWERVVAVLGEALNVRPERVASGSRLYADLGMLYGMD
jgi:hypothetical protein